MRRTVAKMLKKEATPGHTYKQLKKEYRQMKSPVGEPKPKREPRKSGQLLGIVKVRIFKDVGKQKRHSKNVYSIVDKSKFSKRVKKS